MVGTSPGSRQLRPGLCRPVLQGLSLLTRPESAAWTPSFQPASPQSNPNQGQGTVPKAPISSPGRSRPLLPAGTALPGFPPPGRGTNHCCMAPLGDLERKVEPKCHKLACSHSRPHFCPGCQSTGPRESAGRAAGPRLGRRVSTLWFLCPAGGPWAILPYLLQVSHTSAPASSQHSRPQRER